MFVDVDIQTCAKEKKGGNHHQKRVRDVLSIERTILTINQIKLNPSAIISSSNQKPNQKIIYQKRNKKKKQQNCSEMTFDIRQPIDLKLNGRRFIDKMLLPNVQFVDRKSIKKIQFIFPSFTFGKLKKKNIYSGE